MHRPEICNFIKKEALVQVYQNFSVNFVKFSRTAFFTAPPGDCFCKTRNSPTVIPHHTPTHPPTHTHTHTRTHTTHTHFFCKLKFFSCGNTEIYELVNLLKLNNLFKFASYTEMRAPQDLKVH